MTYDLFSEGIPVNNNFETFLASSFSWNKLIGKKLYNWGQNVELICDTLHVTITNMHISFLRHFDYIASRVIGNKIN